MIEVKGNLWTYVTTDGQRPDVIVITTNGTVKKNGECVMGRGCAFEAKGLYPGLAADLGSAIKLSGNHVFVLGVTPMLMSFPVKHQWFEKADIELIQRSAKELVEVFGNRGMEAIKTVVMPRPGCGNGRLSWPEVKKILEPILDDRFHVITF